MQASKQRFPTPVDKTTVERQWFERGFSCDWFSDPPGREWNDFVHNCNELVTVVEGRLELCVNGERCLLDPGDEFFIPKGALHSVRNVYHGTTHWLYGYD